MAACGEWGERLVDRFASARARRGVYLLSFCLLDVSVFTARRATWTKWHREWSPRCRGGKCVPTLKISHGLLSSNTNVNTHFRILYLHTLRKGGIWKYTHKYMCIWLFECTQKTEYYVYTYTNIAIYAHTHKQCQVHTQICTEIHTHTPHTYAKCSYLWLV